MHSGKECKTTLQHSPLLLLWEQAMWTVPALPLGELGNCLTLQVEGGPKLLEKNRVVGAKKRV